MKKYICSICGQSTEHIDYEYLIGFDHLSCVLNQMDDVSKNKGIEIKNWDKLNGGQLSLLGVDLIIMNTDVSALRHTAAFYTRNFNEALFIVDLWTDNMGMEIKVYTPGQFHMPPFILKKILTKEHIKNPSIFIETVGQLIASSNEARKIMGYLSTLR